MERIVRIDNFPLKVFEPKLWALSTVALQTVLHVYPLANKTKDCDIPE